MVVVVGDSPTEGVVSCSRVVVGAVGAFCSEATYEGFSRRFGQKCAGDGVSCRESARVECSHAWRRPVACGKDAELVIGGASRRGSVRSGGVGLCCEESASGASEGLGSDCFPQGRGCRKCRHCLSFQSTTLQLLSKCEVWWWNNTPVTAAISGANLILRVVHSNTSIRNEKSDILTSCLLVGGVLFRPLAIRRNVSPWSRGRCNTPCSKKAPSAIRCIKTDHTHASQHTTLSVRKHRAPNGALRLHTFRHGLVLSDNVRKHRAP